MRWLHPNRKWVRCSDVVDWLVERKEFAHLKRGVIRSWVLNSSAPGFPAGSTVYFRGADIFLRPDRGAGWRGRCGLRMGVTCSICQRVAPPGREVTYPASKWKEPVQEVFALGKTTSRYYLMAEHADQWNVFGLCAPCLKTVRRIDKRTRPVSGDALLVELAVRAAKNRKGFFRRAA